MKIVVIGGTGLIGSKTVAILRRGGHEVVAASPKSGINTITGEGLKEVMAGTQVVIDLANSPSFEDKAVLEFFETSGRNLLAAEAAAGVRHHVALSIVGTDRTPDNGYFRAKVAQEKLIEASGIPYTIIRATQFLEFLGAIAAASADGNVIRLAPGLFQPIAADDVSAVPSSTILQYRTLSGNSPMSTRLVPPSFSMILYRKRRAGVTLGVTLASAAERAHGTGKTSSLCAAGNSSPQARRASPLR